MEGLSRLRHRSSGDLAALGVVTGQAAPKSSGTAKPLLTAGVVPQSRLGRSRHLELAAGDKGAPECSIGLDDQSKPPVCADCWRWLRTGNEKLRPLDGESRASSTARCLEGLDANAEAKEAKTEALGVAMSLVLARCSCDDLGEPAASGTGMRRPPTGDGSQEPPHGSEIGTLGAAEPPKFPVKERRGASGERGAVITMLRPPVGGSQLPAQGSDTTDDRLASVTLADRGEGAAPLAQGTE